MSSAMYSQLSDDTFSDDLPEELSNASLQQQQEMNDLLAIAKLERDKYRKNLRIIEILEEYASEEDGPDIEFKQKVQRIITGSSTAQLLDMSTDGSSAPETNLLGLQTTCGEKLRLTEGRKLFGILEERWEKGGFVTYPGTVPEYESSSTLCLDSEDQTLIELKNDLISEQKKYIENLSTLNDLLGKITTKRLNDVPQVFNKNIENRENIIMLNQLKTQITLRKIHMDVFESSNTTTFEAYKELLKDIEEQTKVCQQEIQQLTDLKRKYEEAEKCGEYKAILKEYLELKAYIEKKKLIQQCYEMKL